MKAAILGATALLAFSPLAKAQAQTPQAPRPSVAVERLGYYVGTWEGHGQAGAGASGAGGRLASKFTCSWLEGRFQVVCKGWEMGPTGRRAFYNIKSYDEATKSYSEYSVTSLGETEFNKGGTLDGNTLTYQMEQKAEGKVARIRYVEQRVSPRIMTYKAEVSVDGKPWNIMGQGRIGRIK